MTDVLEVPSVTERRTGIARDPLKLCFVVVLVAAAALLWLGPLRTSLSLDETGTYWVVRDGLRETMRRSASVQGQSPMYYLVELFAVRAFGASEAALRFPSLVASAFGALFMFKLGRRLFDTDSALVAATAFVVWPSVMFHAIDARPYALAIAIAVGATLALVRWTQSRRRRHMAIYAASAALLVYAHFLFSVVLLAHAVYLVACVRERRSSWRDVALAFGGVAALCAPLAPQLVSLARRSEKLSWAAGPQLDELVVVLSGPLVIAMVAIVVRRMFGGGPRIDPPTAYLLVGWAAIPPLAAYLVSVVTPIKIFDPRYYVAMVGAQALLVGWAVGRVPVRVGRVFITALLALVLVGIAEPSHAPDDWRDATRIVNKIATDRSTPVLVHSLFIETRDVARLSRSTEGDFLLAPVGYYRLKGTVIPLPYSLEDDQATYVDTLISSSTIRGARRFVVLTNFNHAFDSYVEERVARDGFRREHIGDFGQMRVTVFRR